MSYHLVHVLVTYATMDVYNVICCYFIDNLTQDLYIGVVWFIKCKINGNGNDSHLNTGGDKFE